MMYRTTLTCSTVVLLVLTGFNSFAAAHPRWRCGDGETFDVAIDERCGDGEGRCEDAAADFPGLLTLVAPGPEPVRMALDCTLLGHGLGTEWLCTASDATARDLVVEVRRGRRTGDPWALASVHIGDEVLAEGLPCIVEHVPEKSRADD